MQGLRNRVCPNVGRGFEFRSGRPGGRAAKNGEAGFLVNAGDSSEVVVSFVAGTGLDNGHPPLMGNHLNGGITEQFPLAAQLIELTIDIFRIQAMAVSSDA